MTNMARPVSPRVIHAETQPEAGDVMAGRPLHVMVTYTFH